MSLVQHCRIFSQDHAKKERFIRRAFHGVVGHSPVPCLHGWDRGAVGCEVNWESDGFLNLFLIRLRMISAQFFQNNFWEGFFIYA